MLTRNFENLVGMVPQSSSLVRGMAPFKDVYGMQYFYTGQFPAYPYSRTAAYTSDRNAAGITLGSGSDAPTMEDYNLSAPITSGISVSVTSTSLVMDGDDPVLQYGLTVTNTSSQDVVIAEIGYKQTVAGAPFAGGTSTSNVVALMDRTLVEPQMTIPPSRAAVIEYRLRTAHEDRTVEGVRIVSWQYGSDEDVAAMIAAAHAGTIDLRECGWQVGDMRAVEIGSFVAGGNVSVPAQTLDLAISSFEDYEGCGCVMQADFAEALSVALRMGASNSETHGYASTEMCATTLPAMAGALPEWLSEALLEFDVKAGAGDGTTETVVRNKLALRSEVEIRGTNGGGSAAGEGSQVPWYQSADKMRQRRRGRAGSNGTYWLRSPRAGAAGSFMRQSGTSSVSYGNQSEATADGIAPFMCL